MWYSVFRFHGEGLIHVADCDTTTDAFEAARAYRFRCRVLRIEVAASDHYEELPVPPVKVAA